MFPVYPWHALVPCLTKHRAAQTVPVSEQGVHGFKAENVSNVVGM